MFWKNKIALRSPIYNREYTKDIHTAPFLITASLYNRAAMLGRETAEVFGVTADTNHQIGIFFGMLLRVEQLLTAYAGNLHLHSALSKVAVHQTLEAKGQQL